MPSTRLPQASLISLASKHRNVNLTEDEFFNIEPADDPEGEDEEFSEYGRDLFEDNNMEPDVRSERYFDQFRLNRAEVPQSYSSVDLGLISPAKHQVCIILYRQIRGE